MIGLFLFGAVGGFAALAIGAPMPFLSGGAIGSALFVLFYERRGRKLEKPPRAIRLCGIAVTGAIIGCAVTPELLIVLPEFWISGAAILPFIVLAHAGGYAIMRRFGHYTAVDAYYASMPGGLVEAVLLGEKAGADVRLLTVQHFLRVISIVISVPLIFLLTTGEVVGSAAGMEIGRHAYGSVDLVWIVAIAAVGFVIGRFSRIPAHQLMGPLLLAMLLSINGIIDIAVPPWLLQSAQYLVGTTLGAQFSGVDRRLLLRGLHMGVLSVGYMLAVGFAFALLLSPWVPAGTSALFVSFAAGGVTEMSLIALSLNLSPVIVAMHHLIRIFLTVWLASGLAAPILGKSLTEP